MGTTSAHASELISMFEISKNITMKFERVLTIQNGTNEVCTKFKFLFYFKNNTD